MLREMFNSVAVLSKGITSSNNEQLREELKRVSFRCYEYTGNRKGQFNPLERVQVDNEQITICTYDKIAKTIRSDDTIEFDNSLYSVDSIDKIRSFESPNKYNYLITMKLGS